jgi:hypothetical protein
LIQPVIRIAAQAIEPSHPPFCNRRLTPYDYAADTRNPDVSIVVMMVMVMMVLMVRRTIVAVVVVVVVVMVVMVIRVVRWRVRIRVVLAGPDRFLGLGCGFLHVRCIVGV